MLGNGFIEFDKAEKSMVPQRCQNPAFSYEHGGFDLSLSLGFALRAGMTLVP